MKKVKSISKAKSTKSPQLKVSPLIRSIKNTVRKKPDSLAMKATTGWKLNGEAKYETRTFAEVDRESDRIAHGLERAGIVKGMHTVLMVTPGPEFCALVSALLKIGAILVLVDPGMGTSKLKKCLGEAEPEAFIGISKAHLARVLLRWGADTIRITVTVGKRLCWGGYTLGQIEKLGSEEPYTANKISDEQTMMIAFTSGNTGIPKGVVLTHGNFNAQFDILKKDFKMKSDDIDLTTFPPFALFGLAVGYTSIIPDMDASRPGSSNPKKLIKAINENKCTTMFGSPAIIEKLGKYCTEHDIDLPSLKIILSAGAPARMVSLDRFVKRLSSGIEVLTPYGATEALPVTLIGTKTLLGKAVREINSGGGGVCVGKPVRGMTVAIIGITEEPIEKWSAGLKVKTGVIGEICVKGPVVTKVYYNRPVQTGLAKIAGTRSGEIWHRMGDVGYLDKKGFLWMCGRKGHRVESGRETFFSIPCEAIFDRHPDVFRSALVGVEQGDKTIPVICIELEKGLTVNADTREKLVQKFIAMAKEYKHTKSIKAFLFHPEFPVDVRHNAKINREQLAEWAEKQQG